MITLSNNGDAIVFTFVNSDFYLYGNGTLTVPPNSLSLILDDSGTITFYKAATNDVFVSAPASEWEQTPTEIEQFYKTSMVSAGGGSAIKELYLGTAYDTVDASTCEVTKYEVGDVVCGHTITDEDFHYLIYVYTNENQECSLTAVDMDNYITENEFRSGTTVVNHVVRGVVDPRSEKVHTEYSDSGTPIASGDVAVLSVNESGFTVGHIQDAINEAVDNSFTHKAEYVWDSTKNKMVIKYKRYDGTYTDFVDIFETNAQGEILLLNKNYN